MIRCVLVTDGGCIVALGIVEENVRRMKAGQPLALNIGRLLSDAGRVGDGDGLAGTVSLMVAYGETHEAIVEQWNRELASSGLTMGEAALVDARALDEQLREEGRL